MVVPKRKRLLRRQTLRLLRSSLLRSGNAYLSSMSRSAAARIYFLPDFGSAFAGLAYFITTGDTLPPAVQARVRTSLTHSSHPVGFERQSPVSLEVDVTLHVSG